METETSGVVDQQLNGNIAPELPGIPVQIASTCYRYPQIDEGQLTLMIIFKSKKELMDKLEADFSAGPAALFAALALVFDAKKE